MTEIIPILQRSPVIPVAVVGAGVSACDLARALLAGGISIIEITLRTPQGLAAIGEIKRRVSGICIGAGTVWTAQEALQAMNAGAEFVVSPGRSDEVFKVCRMRGVPYLPGVQTVSEAAHWSQQGLAAVKFFPAGVAGGVAALKAFSSVLPDLKFCPTGGISAATAPDYLALPSVPCVGGSWLLEEQAIAAGDWRRITELAAEAAQL